jgi:MFS family permease
MLVLAITHSAVRAGIVAFARGVPAALFLLPAGLAADRYDRRTLMIVAGALLGAVSARATVAVFVAFALVLALWGTVSPALRGVSRV